MSADKPKVDLGLLEEDDDFEEFPTERKYRETSIFFKYSSKLYITITVFI